jgi:hypothetical protein
MMEKPKESFKERYERRINYKSQPKPDERGSEQNNYLISSPPQTNDYLTLQELPPKGLDHHQ